MRSLTGNILSFMIDNIKILYLVISIIILLEGIIYLLFPNHVKRMLLSMTSILWRILGIVVIGLGVVLLYLYKEFLYSFF